MQSSHATITCNHRAQLSHMSFRRTQPSHATIAHNYIAYVFSNNFIAMRQFNSWHRMQSAQRRESFLQNAGQSSSACVPPSRLQKVQNTRTSRSLGRSSKSVLNLQRKRRCRSSAERSSRRADTHRPAGISNLRHSLHDNATAHTIACNHRTQPSHATLAHNYRTCLF